MIDQHLSFAQRLHNAIGAQEIEQVKAWHAYTHGMGYSKEEWDAVSVSGRGRHLGHFFGRMVGWDEAASAPVVNPEEGYYERYCSHILNYKGASYLHALKRGLYGSALPCIRRHRGGGGRHDRPKPHPTPGTMMARMSPNKIRNGGFLWERYGSDFAYDCTDGKWYYFHEQVCPDIGSEYGTKNWAMEMYQQEISGKQPFGPPPEDDPADSPAPASKSNGHGRPWGLSPRETQRPSGGPPCTDVGPLHNNASMTQTVQNTVPWPEPYGC